MFEVALECETTQTADNARCPLCFAEMSKSLLSTETVAQQYLAGSVLCGNLFHCKRNAVVFVKCVPVGLQHGLCASCAWQKQGIAAKAGQGIALSLIGGEAKPESWNRRSRTIGKAICIGGIERVGLQNAERDGSW
jgi:hypothetical protein